MRLATIAAAMILTLTFAGAASAQRRSAVVWQQAPTTFGGFSSFGGFTTPYWYQAQPYGYQSYWNYNYMPYGYDAYGLPWASAGLQYGYLPPNYAAPARDHGPPARARTSGHPDVSYSEFAREEEQRVSERRGYINVSLPSADAKVWINGQLMTQAGKERSFMTPVLDSTALAYSFEIRASWTDQFGAVTKESKIQVRAGETKDVVFAAK